MKTLATILAVVTFMTLSQTVGTVHAAEGTLALGFLDVSTGGGGGEVLIAQARPAGRSPRLNIRSHQDIGRREAELILRELGFIERAGSYQAALDNIHYTYTYQDRRNVPLDNDQKHRLFREYNMYKHALARWGRYPTISAHATPQLFDRWVQEAAAELTAVPAAQRVRLIRSLLFTESRQTQWNNFTPVVSNAGAVGFGQLLAATARQGRVNINPYDPAENIRGTARYMNALIREHGSVRRGLAAYNGGNHPPTYSFVSYADPIMRRVGM